VWTADVAEVQAGVRVVSPPAPAAPVAAAAATVTKDGVVAAPLVPIVPALTAAQVAALPMGPGEALSVTLDRKCQLLKIEIWNENTVSDDLIGAITIGTAHTTHCTLMISLVPAP
jgi:hypothetical protein